MIKKKLKLNMFIISSFSVIGLLSACGQPGSEAAKNASQSVNANSEITSRSVKAVYTEPVESYLEAIKNKDVDGAFDLLYNKSSIEMNEFKKSIESSTVESFEILDSKSIGEETYKVLTHTYHDDGEREIVFITKKNGNTWLIDLNVDKTKDNLNF